MTPQQAYRHCRAIARGHYENFPVASLVLPHRLRDPVAAIYAFARAADDLADEGDHPPEARLAALDQRAEQLEAAGHGQPDPDDPVAVALADAIDRHSLPLQPFRDLLSAFRQDVEKRRYADFGEVMDYCRRSANPVGRLLLALYDIDDERTIAHSDALCSGLQLVNFLQDIAQDYDENDRIYLPAEDMARFGVDEAHIRDRVSDAAMRALLQFEIDRARKLLRGGAGLGKRLPGRMKYEARLILYGGVAILGRLHAQPADDLFSRPRLRPRDRAWMLWRTLLPR